VFEISTAGMHDLKRVHEVSEIPPTATALQGADTLLPKNQNAMSVEESKRSPYESLQRLLSDVMSMTIKG